ncbi:MAG TPA: glycosyltransferase [Steroidobacteraceae bacterium]|nr:glycosyltransferase [Steroidobacteraceae bacterium]
MGTPAADMSLSVIIPVGGRQADLAELHADYQRELLATGERFEMIFVLDGVQPAAATTLQRLKNAGADIVVVGLTRSFGEATALMAGFERSRGERILILPAYHQIDSREIGKLLGGLASADVCTGRRWPRVGGAFERVRRAAFHGLLSWITKVRVRDVGCGARALKRRVLEEIPLYGDQSRFLPVLADRQGFKVTEIDVRQSPRDRFEGVYRPREYARRLLDIFTVFFLVRFTKRPLRFFGMIGASMFILGVLVLLELVIERLFGGVPLADRPALLLSSLFVVLGLQLFALGLLGELVIFTHARHIKDYQVAEVIEYGPAAPTQSSEQQLPSTTSESDGFAPTTA